MKKVEVEEVKTLEEMKKEYKLLKGKIEDYLIDSGVSSQMVQMVIDDLTAQMHSTPDEKLNGMIADLINLENDIAFAEEKESSGPSNS